MFVPTYSSIQTPTPTSYLSNSWVPDSNIQTPSPTSYLSNSWVCKTWTQLSLKNQISNPTTPIQTNFGRFMSFSKVKEVENFVKTKFEP